MTRLISFLLILFFISGVNYRVNCQDTNGIVVEISKEKTLINGKTFYLHTVKKGENLFRISKAYKVSQKDIVLYNPETISGKINEGEILKIPAEGQVVTELKQLESGNFIYHITEEQQTIFFLTQKYNVTREILFKYNPELEFSPLQVGQVVRIPKTENVSSGAETFSPIVGYEEHKVKRKETKYSIATENGITVDELIAANPILNTEDLQTGSTIRIPKKSATSINTQPLVNKIDSFNLTQKDSEIITNVEYKPVSDVIKIALLLPFSIEDNFARAKLDSAAMANDPKKIIKTEILTRSVYSLEFYNGFLVALDSLKKAGISVKVFVFDTEREVPLIKRILKKPEMSEMDLIIGPFFQEGLASVSEFSKKNRILMVSPVITDDTILLSNPYGFEVLPNSSNSVNQLILSANKIEKRNIILIESSDPQDSTLNKIYKKQLDSIAPGYKIVKQNQADNLVKYYSENSVNLIFTPSNNEAVLSSMFSKFSLDAKTVDLKVFGQPSIARSNSIEQIYFHNLEFHFYSPFYIDYDNEKVNRFYNTYQRMFNSEPINFNKEGFNFALYGFDLTTYFVGLLNAGIENLDKNLAQPRQLLHMNMQYIRETPGSCYVNKGLNILAFTRDFYLKKVDSNH